MIVKNKQEIKIPNLNQQQISSIYHLYINEAMMDLNYMKIFNSYFERKIMDNKRSSYRILRYIYIIFNKNVL